MYPVKEAFILKQMTDKTNLKNIDGTQYRKSTNLFGYRF